MMEKLSIIYEPKGAAREYAELALNPYRGCTHRCIYCYNNGRFGKKGDFQGFYLLFIALVLCPEAEQHKEGPEEPKAPSN